MAKAALPALADICDVASLITSFVTASARDALPLTLATAKAVLDASAADEALPLMFDVAVLLPAVAPCAAILALDCIFTDANLATFANAALLAFDANFAFTVTVLVANAALLAFDEIRAFTVTVLVANAALLALPAIRLEVVLVTVASAAEDALALIWTVATLPRTTNAADLALAASCDARELVLDVVSLRSAREDSLAAISIVLAGGSALIAPLAPPLAVPILAAGTPDPKARPKTPNLGPPRKPANGAAIGY